MNRLREKTTHTILLIVLMASIGTVSLVLAKGPTNAGGRMPYAPYNDNAWWHSGQYIGPSVFGAGTPTTIVEDDVTIYVGLIPDATFNENTGEWEGTYLMWKANYNAKEYSFSMKFWLNGFGPVTITYDYGEYQITEQATEFIFFKSGYIDGVWTHTLQAYK